MLRTRLLLSLATVAAAAGGAATLATGPADAKSKKCAKHTTEVVRVGGSVLWTDAKKTILYGCSFYSDKPALRKLGPWTKQSKAAFTGSTVVWTVRTKAKNGAKEDRIWISDASEANDTWVRGVRPTTGVGSASDVRVERLVAYGSGAAWVTSKGTLVMAVPSGREDPNTIPYTPEPGTTPTTPAATTPAGTTPASTTPAATTPAATTPAATTPPPTLTGLALPFAPQGKRLVVGHWPDVDIADLADSLELTIGSNGDGDECGGVDPYQATVRPVAGQPRVGAEWFNDWSSASGVCS
jgi:hypothetical protein